MTTEGKCLGRLTNWDKTNFRIASCFTVSLPYQCGRKTDGELCEKCLERPRDGKYQTRMLHGLITEPIPAVSALYGSPMFWQKMKKLEDAGDRLSAEAKEWIQAAEATLASQAEAGGWKVQRPSDKEVEKEMKKALASKAKAKAKEKLIPKPTQTLTQTQNLKEIFKPVELRFKEVDKPVVKMETDSIDLCKMVIGDITVLIVDDLVFDVDTKGEPGDHIGYYRDGEFIEL
jgi:hypothetical protein